MTDSVSAENRIRLMSQANRQTEIVHYAVWLLVAVVAAIGSLLFLEYRDLPVVRITDGSAGGGVTWQSRGGEPETDDWGSFVRRGDAVVPDAGSLAKRFRLAGTFVEYGGETGDTRKAVLDNLHSGKQGIVSEKEKLGDVEVVRIFRESVILRDSNGEGQLWLSFSERPGSDAGGTGDAGASGAGSKRMLAGIDRFGGKQIGERRWVFKRAALLDYYRELMEHPERLVQVFDSLKPVYDDNHKITGYRVGVEGEDEFFKSAGLKENDILRSVNSLKMTNRRRAERFIHEFVNNRINTFVLDVDRAGKTEKMIYQVR